jgi:hypothetical protein
MICSPSAASIGIINQKTTKVVESRGRFSPDSAQAKPLLISNVFTHFMVEVANRCKYLSSHFDLQSIPEADIGRRSFVWFPRLEFDPHSISER